MSWKWRGGSFHSQCANTPGVRFPQSVSACFPGAFCTINFIFVCSVLPCGPQQRRDALLPWGEMWLGYVWGVKEGFHLETVFMGDFLGCGMATASSWYTKGAVRSDFPAPPWGEGWWVCLICGDVPLAHIALCSRGNTEKGQGHPRVGRGTAF